MMIDNINTSETMSKSPRSVAGHPTIGRHSTMNATGTSPTTATSSTDNNGNGVEKISDAFLSSLLESWEDEAKQQQQQQQDANNNNATTTKTAQAEEEERSVSVPLEIMFEAHNYSTTSFNSTESSRRSIVSFHDNDQVVEFDNHEAPRNIRDPDHIPEDHSQMSDSQAAPEDYDYYLQDKQELTQLLKAIMEAGDPEGILKMLMEFPLPVEQQQRDEESLVLQASQIQTKLQRQAKSIRYKSKTNNDNNTQHNTPDTEEEPKPNTPPTTPTPTTTPIIKRLPRRTSGSANRISLPKSISNHTQSTPLSSVQDPKGPLKKPDFSAAKAVDTTRRTTTTNSSSSSSSNPQQASSTASTTSITTAVTASSTTTGSRRRIPSSRLQLPQPASKKGTNKAAIMMPHWCQRCTCFVRTGNSNNNKDIMKIQMDPDTPFVWLKQQIQQHTGIAVANQQLSYDGLRMQQLHNDKTLRDYRLLAGGFFTLKIVDNSNSNVA